MADFSTTALLEVELDEGSLQDAEDTIERRLGNAGSVSAGGGRTTRTDGGPRSTTRQLDEMLSQDETRNRLLEKLVRQSGDGEGRGQGGLGGLGNLLGGLTGAIGAIGVGALIGRTASIQPADLVGDVPTITPGDLIGGVPTITPSDLIGGVPDIVPEDLVSGVPDLTPDDLIGGVPSVAVGDLVGEAASLTSEAVLDALIESPVAISPQQIADQVTPNTGDIGSQINAEAGAIAAGAAGAGAGIVAGGSRIVSGVRGAVPTPGAPSIGIPAIGPLIADRLDIGPDPGDTAAGGGVPTAASTGVLQRSAATRADVTIQNQVQIDPNGMQGLRQQLEQEVSADVTNEVMRRVESQLSL